MLITLNNFSRINTWLLKMSLLQFNYNEKKTRSTKAHLENQEFILYFSFMKLVQKLN